MPWPVADVSVRGSAKPQEDRKQCGNRRCDGLGIFDSHTKDNGELRRGYYGSAEMERDGLVASAGSLAC
jgi:hypothetical protein